MVDLQGDTTVRDLHRLAAKGRAQGVTVTCLGDGSCVATSSSDATRLYYVDTAAGPTHGCDCEGWATYRRCKHYALALLHLGQLDDDDPPPTGGGTAPGALARADWLPAHLAEYADRAVRAMPRFSAKARRLGDGELAAERALAEVDARRAGRTDDGAATAAALTWLTALAAEQQARAQEGAPQQRQRRA